MKSWRPFTLNLILASAIPAGGMSRVSEDEWDMMISIGVRQCSNFPGSRRSTYPDCVLSERKRSISKLGLQLAVIVRRNKSGEASPASWPKISPIGKSRNIRNAFNWIGLFMYHRIVATCMLLLAPEWRLRSSQPPPGSPIQRTGVRSRTCRQAERRVLAMDLRSPPQIE